MAIRNEYLEFSPDGVIRHTRRLVFWWKAETLVWSNVISIEAVLWDCFACHTSGFRFWMSDTEQMSVTDMDDQWDEFRDMVFKVFPDIDQSVIDTVEAIFPGEAEETCWTKNFAEQVAASDR